MFYARNPRDTSVPIHRIPHAAGQIFTTNHANANRSTSGLIRFGSEPDLDAQEWTEAVSLADQWGGEDDYAERGEEMERRHAERREALNRSIHREDHKRPNIDVSKLKRHSTRYVEPSRVMNSMPVKYRIRAAERIAMASEGDFTLQEVMREHAKTDFGLVFERAEFEGATDVPEVERASRSLVRQIEGLAGHRFDLIDLGDETIEILANEDARKNRERNERDRLPGGPLDHEWTIEEAAEIRRMECPQANRRRLKTLKQRAFVAAEHAFYPPNLNADHRYVNSTLTKDRLSYRDRERTFLAERVIVDEAGTTVALSQVVQNGLKAKRAQLYAMALGMKDHADRMDYVPVFVTVTLPGSWHRQTVRKFKAGPRKGQVRFSKPNTGWNGRSIADANLYLSERLALLRKSIREAAGADYFGVCVREPHTDGTPHAHIMIFVPNDHDETILLHGLEKKITVSPTERVIATCLSHRTRHVEIVEQERLAGLGLPTGKRIFRDEIEARPYANKEEGDKAQANVASYLFKYLMKGRETGENGLLVASDMDAWKGAMAGRSHAWWGLGRGFLSAWKAIHDSRTESSDDEPLANARRCACLKNWGQLFTILIDQELEITRDYEIRETRYGAQRKVLIAWADADGVVFGSKGRWTIRLVSEEIKDACQLDLVTRGDACGVPEGHKDTIPGSLFNRIREQYRDERTKLRT